MALAIASGIISCLAGALKIASAFKTQSSTQIVGSGKGTGFFKFYSNSAVGTRSIAARSCGAYIDRMISNIMADQSAIVQAHKQNIINDLTDIKDFESYAWGDCDNMVNTVSYEKASGSLYMYIYTFSPFISDTRGEGVRVSNMKIHVDFVMPKDWIIVSKIKSSFFKCTMNQEIQYLDTKSIQMSDVIEAVAIAVAPAVLGLVKLPERFLNVLDTVIKSQMANPDRGIVTAPTAEQSAQAYAQFQDMRNKQQEYDQRASEGFSDIKAAIDALGQKGPETPAA
ncbi:hypothetical protein TVAG_265530 [Trichomonas vaginalis G3]|uniref:Uncharacterized protein n=1 Tax=Trichomonas vaginalis (strain ATCC PRA-98 / G3) TaxID=412133 RepID=A2FGB8_TRIV3|nr:hypothetical protein TVAGG3_0623130 [Trichomonas vaginalis G3]EAX96064.1 hypothetical protein TVAG_265530 [Trichomonas vaginalis G3]KAI5504008.1 hypothetical protein TVAGG3_0623130 [Trichomonas vaginalis G3]|eukprot:XP_001308994.1 hypothetical protein [Trichomonas vaginalis G3]